MRAGFFSIAAAVLLQLAVAQPHGKAFTLSSILGTDALLAIRHRHHRRQDVVVTHFEVVTVEASEVIVYVNQNGEPISTTTIVGNQATPTAIPSTPSLSTPVPSIASATSTSTPAPPLPPAPAQSSSSLPPPAVPTTPATSPSAQPPPESSPSPPTVPPPAPSPSPVTSTPATPASSAAPVQSDAPSSPHGPGFRSAISYSPYNPDQTCKLPAQVAKDLEQIESFSVVRLYGTDCNQTANVLAATQGKNVQIFAGFFDINDIPNQVQLLSSAVGGDWSRVNTVSVGNELVNNGAASAGSVIAAMDQARGLLKTAGYSGPVVTVDTMVAMKANIELCHASDYCAINCHAFFDPHVSAEGAADFVLGWAQEISSLAGGKTTVITETGWPSSGESHHNAVPSKENQDMVVSALKSKFSSNMILFSAYNNKWRHDSSGTFGAEKFWGILGDAPSESG
ncbi:MAG: hypothetical protein Q9187_001902 [Circinaria calcarea]